MRRMISQKQIEGLDNLNKTIEVTKIEGGDDYVTLKTNSVFMEGNYPFIEFAQNDDTEVWGYIGNDGASFSVGVTDDGASYSQWGIDFSNGVNITHGGNEIAKFGDNITLTAHEENSERSFSINTHGIQSPVDEYSLCFGLDFDGEQGGVLWTDEPGAGLVVAPNGNVQLYGGTSIKIVGLPTSDPHVKNQLWNDNGVLKISSGN